eukprot:2224564-Pleurochrysis_carterae.AAC.3
MIGRRLDERRPPVWGYADEPCVPCWLRTQGRCYLRHILSEAKILLFAICARVSEKTSLVEDVYCRRGNTVNLAVRSRLDVALGTVSALLRPSS